MRSVPAERSDRMMMLMPSRTACSASRAKRIEGRLQALRRRARPARSCRACSDLNASCWRLRRIERIFSRSSSVEDRLAHLQPLGVREPFEVEQVRPRPDDRDEAHHQLFADRIDRRVGDLGEVLLEVGEQELRLVRQRRDRRVVAHGADRLLALHRHRRHQDFQVFLGVAEHLLAIEQREIRQRRGRRPHAGISSSTIWVRSSHSL